jgi:hypothetical protein
MDLSEVYRDAKKSCPLGEPLIELPAEKILRDARGRFYVEVSVLVAALQAGHDGSHVVSEPNTETR